MDEEEDDSIEDRLVGAGEEDGKSGLLMFVQVPTTTRVIDEKWSMLWHYVYYYFYSHSYSFMKVISLLVARCSAFPNPYSLCQWVLLDHQSCEHHWCVRHFITSIFW